MRKCGGGTGIHLRFPPALFLTCRILSLALLPAFSAPGTASAADPSGRRPQEWHEAWEPDARALQAAVPIPDAVPAAEAAPTGNPVTGVLLMGIGYYRSDIGPRSISRCPFRTSCSRFAQLSLRRWGILGVVPFTDRFLYRENVQTASLYLPWLSPQTGTIKSDDDFYLPAP